MTAIYSLRGFILELICFNFLFASVPTEGQELKEIKMNINLKNVTLESAFKEIEKHSNIKFFYVKGEIPLNENVTISVSEEPLSELLEGLAIQYNLNFQRINDQIVVRRSAQRNVKPVFLEGGGVKGKIVDAKTKESLAFANIIIYKAGEKIVASGGTTDMNGNYLIEGLLPGKYSLEVKYVGYVTKFENFTVSGNKILEINFKLESSLVDLDEIVVTGSFSNREKKELSNPVTIISMENVLQTMPAVTNITDILTYNVPGYFQDVANELTFGNNLNPIIRGSSSSSSKQLLIYIDGVPVSNESYKSTSLLTVVAADHTPTVTPQQDINKLVNINDIEKIEVLRGPMASTLYGSGAGNGVINIITKKSASSRTRFSASGNISTISDNYSDKTPLKTNQTLNLSGGTGQIGYNLGLSRTTRDYTYLPSVLPRYTSLSLNAGSKVNIEPVMIDLRLDYITTEGGAQSTSKLWDIFKQERGWVDTANTPQSGSANYKLDNRTINTSVILKHIIMENWYHSLLFGYNSYVQDRYDYKAPTAPNRWNVSNSVMLKNSMRYFTNFYFHLFDKLKFDFTGGVEYWKSSYDNTTVSTAYPYDGQISNAVINATNARKTYRKDENYGFFGETLWGFDESLFLTAGLRVEQYSKDSSRFGLAQAPRVGLSYVHQFGDIQIKPRISYGSTITPPRWEQVVGIVSTTTTILPNPDLREEKNAGYEAGADIYFSDNFSLELTYYNQIGSDLIFIEILPTLPGQPGLQQYKNVGKVVNKGLELAGSISLQPFQLNITYSYMDNHYGSNYQGFNEGDRVLDSPHNIFNASLSFTFPDYLCLADKSSSVSVQMQHRGSVFTRDYLTLYDSRYLPGATPLDSAPYIETGAYNLFNFSVNYWLADYLQFIFDVRNVFDTQLVKGQFYPLVGREVALGLRFNL